MKTAAPVMMSLLTIGATEPQNPDPLKPKGSATRKSETSSSALTYWSGIIQPCAFVNREKCERVGHPPPPLDTRSTGELFNGPGQLVALP